MIAIGQPTDQRGKHHARTLCLPLTMKGRSGPNEDVFQMRGFAGIRLVLASRDLNV